jgi:hypothetical protein
MMEIIGPFIFLSHAITAKIRRVLKHARPMPWKKETVTGLSFITRKNAWAAGIAKWLALMMRLNGKKPPVL